VFFTGTVVVALVDRTSDWTALVRRFGAWITVHGVVMVLAGVLFGVAVLRAGVLPRWTGAALIVGMVLMAATTALPDGVRTAAAGVRDLAFAAMGLALLQRAARHGARPASSKLGTIAPIDARSEAVPTLAAPRTTTALPGRR
jgi:hypothetical protein